MPLCRKRSFLRSNRRCALGSSWPQHDLQQGSASSDPRNPYLAQQRICRAGDTATQSGARRRPLSSHSSKQDTALVSDSGWTTEEGGRSASAIGGGFAKSKCCFCIGRSSCSVGKPSPPPNHHLLTIITDRVVAKQVVLRAMEPKNEAVSSSTMASDARNESTRPSFRYDTLLKSERLRSIFHRLPLQVIEDTIVRYGDEPPVEIMKRLRVANDGVPYRAPGTRSIIFASRAAPVKNVYGMRMTVKKEQPHADEASRNSGERGDGDSEPT